MKTNPFNDTKQNNLQQRQGVLVRHLLSHTSGIEDYALNRDYYDVVDGWAFDDTVDGMIREAMAKDWECAGMKN